MRNLARKSAFTLIEMLVVVLIIGILAAIVLPQYMTAVDKSKLSQAIISARALAEAETRYQLANGNWAEDMRQLDISFEGGRMNDSGNYIFYPWGFCYTACGNDNSCGGCALNQGDLVVIVLYSPWKNPLKYCYAGAGKERSDHLCQIVTQKTTPSSAYSQYTIYKF